MVPGFAMLEAGIVRTKMLLPLLTINTLFHAVASMVFYCLVIHFAFGRN